jgi:hypothetical protein
MRLTPAALLLVPVFAAACTSLSPDEGVVPQSNTLGSGLRIAQIQDPNSTYYKLAIANPAAGVQVDVTSAVITWVDTFDETKDGKSIGTVYVQDVGSQAPYSGIDLYSPSFVPSSLRPLPGDVLDLAGPYEESIGVGSAQFLNTGTLPQLAKPVGTFRYTFQTPAPTTVQLFDLTSPPNYAAGRQWENMLVTLNDITLGAGQVDTTGKRVSYLMTQYGDAGPDPVDAATLTNELYDLGMKDFPAGTHFKSVTGIVTWFFSYAVAPRSRDDLVLE